MLPRSQAGSNVCRPVTIRAVHTAITDSNVTRGLPFALSTVACAVASPRANGVWADAAAAPFSPDGCKGATWTSFTPAAQNSDQVGAKGRVGLRLACALWWVYDLCWLLLLLLCWVCVLCGALIRGG